MWKLSAFLSILVITGCQSDKSESPEVFSPVSTVFIDIDVQELLKVAQTGDEVPEFVNMYNGEANHANHTNGEANLITEVIAGEEIVWRLGNAEDVTITGFEFFVIEGENVFELPGGQAPILQPDGSWKAIVSPEAAPESLMKYNVHFEVEGQGSYWWDPLIRTSSKVT